MLRFLKCEKNLRNGEQCYAGQSARKQSDCGDELQCLPEKRWQLVHPHLAKFGVEVLAATAYFSKFQAIEFGPLK